MAGKGVGFDAGAVYRERYVRRLPARLSDLTGPEHGHVELPLHIVWSGLHTFDLDKPLQRMSLYRTVLAEGMRDDLCRFLNSDLLIALWQTLHRLIGRAVREAWEGAFPELRTARVST
ncbi:hypothetical protein ACFY1U_28200 [Streptomyces sp. NPDC001351]|uniref:hypothetical protein n=1 Tax=Streptomyces sp. NPDC001351 TaxID=3364564 RepID=UPI00367CD693